MRLALRDGLMTGFLVVCSIAADTGDLRFEWYLVQHVEQSGASRMRLSVTSLARISSVAASMPRYNRCATDDGSSRRTSGFRSAFAEHLLNV